MQKYIVYVIYMHVVLYACCIAYQKSTVCHKSIRKAILQGNIYKVSQKSWKIQRFMR